MYIYIYREREACFGSTTAFYVKTNIIRVRHRHILIYSRDSNEILKKKKNKINIFI